MSDNLTGVYTAKAEAERPAVIESHDNGRHMIGWTREELMAYFAKCASRNTAGAEPKDRNWS